MPHPQNTLTLDRTTSWAVILQVAQHSQTSPFAVLPSSGESYKHQLSFGAAIRIMLGTNAFTNRNFPFLCCLSALQGAPLPQITRFLARPLFLGIASCIDRTSNRIKR